MNKQQVLAYILYRRKRQLIEHDWRARHKIVYGLHPEYREPCSRSCEDDHRIRWRPFRRVLRLDTLRICANISRISDPRIVPEEIFASDIERCLNRLQWGPFLEHKSYCTRLLPSAIFPQTYVHNINGMYFDREFRPLPPDQLRAILRNCEYPVVIKPNTDSSGGRGVSFPAGCEDLLSAMQGQANFVVQERIRQHAFFQRFNRCGINTLRINTYRSVVTEEVAILNVALRMGKGGSLDNETAGGIVSFVGSDGRINNYAVDKYGEKFTAHPDTGICFSEAGVIPKFTEMGELVRTLASRIPTARLIAWDMILDKNNEWRCIELNLEGHTIRFAQYAGHPFFGDFTDEIIEYCLRNPNFRRASSRVW